MCPYDMLTFYSIYKQVWQRNLPYNKIAVIFIKVVQGTQRKSWMIRKSYSLRIKYVNYRFTYKMNVEQTTRKAAFFVCTNRMMYAQTRYFKHGCSTAQKKTSCLSLIIDTSYKTQMSIFHLNREDRRSRWWSTIIRLLIHVLHYTLAIALYTGGRDQCMLVSCQYCSSFSPFGSAIEFGLSNVSIMSLTLFFNSRSKRWPPVRSNAEAISYSTEGSGSRMKRAALAMLGRMCHCNARISQRLLSNALLSNGSRSSMRNGSPAPEATSPPCGWSISLFNPGCRSNRLPMKRRIIKISSGGATNVRRASRFANAATNASGKCLQE